METAMNYLPCNGCEHYSFSGDQESCIYFSITSKNIQGVVTNYFRTMSRR